MWRVFQILFVLLWAGLLLVPVGLTLSGLTLVKPVDENRRKVAYPESPTKLSVAATFLWSKDFIRWFEDNFGGRDALIRLKNQIDFSVFEKSDRIHIGRDGFLFYRSLLDQRIPDMERVSAATQKARLNSLEKLGQELFNHGVTLIVMPIPLKFTVYPELLPNSAPRLPADRAFDRFRRGLKQCPHVVTFDVLPRLLAIKDHVQLFNRTDFHWSEPAARRIGDELLAEIGRMSGMPNFKSDWPADFAPRKFSGGQAMFMPLFIPPSETAYFPAKEPPYPSEGKDSPFDWAVRNTETSRQLLPPTVFIGDSFIWALHNSGFTTQFTEFYFSHILKDDSKKLYKQLPAGTRYLVLALLEQNYLVDYDPL